MARTMRLSDLERYREGVKRRERRLAYQRYVDSLPEHPQGNWATWPEDKEI